MHAKRSIKHVTKAAGMLRALGTLFLGLLFLVVACGTNANPGAGGGGSATGGGVSDPYGVVRIKKGDTIHLGNSGPLSGPNASLGKEQENAVKLALDSRSTVKGFKVELIPGDDGCTDSSQASAVANRFISDDKIVGVI